MSRKGKVLHACVNNVCTRVSLQDRSVCVAVSALRPLLFENGDVLVVGSFSAVTVAHVAAVAAARCGRVLVCGADHTPLHTEEIRALLTQMDVKSKGLKEKIFKKDTSRLLIYKG